MKSLMTLEQIFSSFDEAIYIVDKNRKILYFNPVAEKITGFSKSEIIGRHCQNDTLNHVDQSGVKLCIKDCPLVKAMKENVVSEHHIFLHHKDGYRVPVKVKTIPYIEDNDVIGGIEVFNLSKKEDFSNVYEQAKEKLNYIDPLTKVFNRYFLEDLTHNRIKLNFENYDLLFIDVDDFKKVNDQLGHLIGDKLLFNISKTIQNMLSLDDYIIRFGGDEFIVLLKHDVNNHEKAQSIKNLINSTIIREYHYVPSVSIGISNWDVSTSIEKTINEADKALYLAKSLGKNLIEVYK